MAQVYYGINLGKNQDTAVVGTSTNSTDLELRVDTSKIVNREDAYQLIENLWNFVLSQNFPYA